MIRSANLPTTALALLVVMTALVTAGGCTVDDRNVVRWRVKEAIRTVSRSEAIARAEPVITAVTRAITKSQLTAEWAEDVTVRTQLRDRRCAIVVSQAGSFMLAYHGPGQSGLDEAVAAAVKPFGYHNLIDQGPDGPDAPSEVADVAPDDSMLVFRHTLGKNATIDVYLPAHHDQCA